jgi:TfoX/Sxy family transcriptional regulator of competence genes
MAKPKPASTIPPDKLALYDKLVATNPKVKRQGVTLPYTSLNGNMFSFLTADGTLALRLPDAAREEFLKKYKTKLMVQHGAVMKEYVAVPDKLLKKTAELKPHLAMSHEYAKTLKPKPSKKKT